jgi:hypothetical protein
MKDKIKIKKGALDIVVIVLILILVVEQAF